jgi:cytochrome c oxidase assembly factor CtaG
MGRLVAGAKEVRRTERQRISAWPGGRALLWLVALVVLVVVAIGIWVSAKIFL